MRLKMTKKNIIFVVCGVCVLVIILILILFGVNKDNIGVLDTSKEIVKDVFYDEGNSEFNADLKSTDSYCNGISKTVSLNKKNDSEFVATISMKINNVDKKILTSPDVYWVVTMGDISNCSGKFEESMNYGTFIGRNNGDNLILLQDINVLNEEQEYTLWIWLNKNGKDIGTISKKKIDIDIMTNVLEKVD